MLIHTNEIRPYARFAGYVRPGTVIYAGISSANALSHPDPTYARDGRMLYFPKGTGRLEAGGTVYEANENDLFLIPPMCPYAIRSGQYYLVNFDYVYQPDAPERAIPILAHNRAEPVCPVSFSNLPILASTTRINLPGEESRFKKMAELYTAKSFCFRSEMSAYLTLILTDCFKKLLHTDSKLTQICQYIKENAHLPLNNQSIGEHFHYHPNYVNRLFVSGMGTTLHQFLSACRMEKAVDLLCFTGLSVTEIAETTGFRTLSHFSNAFKRVYGCSPQQFRGH